MVKSPSSLPFSTACMRAALLMFSSTISLMPKAAVMPSMPRRSAISTVMAVSEASVDSLIEPPANSSGSSRPSSRSASVTVGLAPPRP
ncbi:hypothetical protein D3C81_1844380 [compost metagenome]